MIGTFSKTTLCVFPESLVRVIPDPPLAVSTHLDTSNDDLVPDLYPHRLQGRADLNLIVALRLLLTRGRHRLRLLQNLLDLCRKHCCLTTGLKRIWIRNAICDTEGEVYSNYGNTAVSLPGWNESGSGIQSVTQRVKFTITLPFHYRDQMTLYPWCNQ